MKLSKIWWLALWIADFCITSCMVGLDFKISPTVSKIEPSIPPRINSENNQIQLLWRCNFSINVMGPCKVRAARARPTDPWNMPAPTSRLWLTAKTAKPISIPKLNVRKTGVQLLSWKASIFSIHPKGTHQVWAGFLRSVNIRATYITPKIM